MRPPGSRILQVVTLGPSLLQTQLYMHLTNYSVNKHNERFERDETENKGSKRSIRWFTEFLQANEHDVAKFWSDISVRLYTISQL